MQSIPLAVLKRKQHIPFVSVLLLHAIHTACGIETLDVVRFRFSTDGTQLHAINTACGIETVRRSGATPTMCTLHAIHTACGIETSARTNGLLQR